MGSPSSKPRDEERINFRSKLGELLDERAKWLARLQAADPYSQSYECVKEVLDDIDLRIDRHVLRNPGR